MKKRYIEEILEQPAAIERCNQHYPTSSDDLVRLVGKFQAGHYRRVVLTGMGGSLYACYPLWLALNKHTAIPAIMRETSEIIHFMPELLADDTLLIAVSQSGESVELVALADRDQRPGAVISITNGIHSTLARWADINLDTMAGDEATVSTKTYTTTLAVLHLLGCQLIGRPLSSAQTTLRDVTSKMRAVLDSWQAALGDIGTFFTDCSTLFYAGRGYSVGNAIVAALITQESSKIGCVGLSTGQFRHGPLELVREGFGMVLFGSSGSTRAIDLRLTEDIARFGGKCVYIASNPCLRSDHVFPWQLPKAPPDLLALLEIIPAQLLTIPLAEIGGFEPAHFLNASKVTTAE